MPHYQQITFSHATSDDAEELVAIRVEAMRESLERLGRFQPERARSRFLSGFEPARTRLIELDGARVGFLVVKQVEGGLLLDHLYIRPGFQGQGLGAAALQLVFAEADAERLPVRVGALRGSRSNRFYLLHGFTQVDQGEFDVYYVRDWQHQAL